MTTNEYLVAALKNARDDMAALVRAYIKDADPLVTDQRLNEIVENWTSIRHIDAALALAGDP